MTRYLDGTTEVHNDTWKQHNSTEKEWIGTTVFIEKPRYPGELHDTLTEEAKHGRTTTCPETPTQQERDTHNLTHLPFRSWCPVCVKARGLPDHHTSKKKNNTTTRPVIQIDYAFVTSQETKEQTTLLTAVDVNTGMSMAAVVNNKGSNDYIIAELVRFLHETGRTQGTLQAGVVQSDQEAAIKQVLRDLSTATGLPIRHSPTYSSQALGAVERWHKQLWALARTLKQSVYDNYQHKVITTTPMFAWMVKHAAWLHNRFQIHDDGKTSYHRRWNKDYTKPLITFGETVLPHYNDYKNNQYKMKN